MFIKHKVGVRKSKGIGALSRYSLVLKYMLNVVTWSFETISSGTLMRDKND